jgi:hypothetical protein
MKSAGNYKVIKLTGKADAPEWVKEILVQDQVFPR